MLPWLQNISYLTNPNCEKSSKNAKQPVGTGLKEYPQIHVRDQKESDKVGGKEKQEISVNVDSAAHTGKMTAPETKHNKDTTTPP